MSHLDALAKAQREGWSGVKEESSTLLARAGSIAPTVTPRVPTGVPVLDAATGGGFVCGAVTMLHGAPGSGKSTLIAQACARVRGSVYISAEESAEQVAARFVRLGNPDQLVGAETKIRKALAAAGSARLVVIDSVSTMKPGIIPAGEAMVEHARRYGCAIVTVCHENKLGQHAGPRQLEHLIDCTLGLLVEPKNRVLVVEKNRFGPAPLAWQLTMTATGFV